MLILICLVYYMICIQFKLPYDTVFDYWNMGSHQSVSMMTSSYGNIFRVTGPLWIHRSPVISPHKGQWCGALMFSLICAWINGWVKSSEAGDLRRHGAHYDVTVMYCEHFEETVLSSGIILGMGSANEKRRYWAHAQNDACAMGLFCKS